MDKKEIQKLVKGLDKAHSNLLSAQGAVESAIAKTMFTDDFSVFYQPGDGFVICDDRSNNAPLSACLKVIAKKGLLSREDYGTLTMEVYEG